MTKVAMVVQDKGGVGKTTLVRALAAAVPTANVIEVDSSRRILELGDRVTYFEMRASRKDIEKSGGRAARSEFDGVINAIAGAQSLTIVDVGANTATALLTMLKDLAPNLHAENIDVAVAVVTTVEPGALAETPRLLGLAKPWAKIFVIANGLHGTIDPALLGKVANSAVVSDFPAQVIDEQAAAIVQNGGLASIEKLDQAALSARFGFVHGARILSDCKNFRYHAMEAVRPLAEWLVS